MEASSNLNRMTAKIAAGDLVVGTVVNSTDPGMTELLATCGYDFIWIDTEHAPNGVREVSAHIVAARAYGVAPVVRVPWNDPVRIKPILEMGPAAVVIPFVNSAEEAQQAVAACRYPPEGVRGFGPTRANNYGADPLQGYLKRAAIEPWIILQIEHIDAVRNLAEICAVAGIGSLLVGPFDLSASMGLAGQVTHPDVAAQLDSVAHVAREHGVTFGAFALSSDEASVDRWIERGVSWLALDTDQALLRGAALRALGLVDSLRS